MQIQPSPLFLGVVCLDKLFYLQCVAESYQYIPCGSLVRLWLASPAVSLVRMQTLWVSQGGNNVLAPHTWIPQAMAEVQIKLHAGKTFQVVVRFTPDLELTCFHSGEILTDMICEMAQ